MISIVYTYNVENISETVYLRRWVQSSIIICCAILWWVIISHYEKFSRKDCCMYRINIFTIDNYNLFYTICIIQFILKILNIFVTIIKTTYLYLKISKYYIWLFNQSPSSAIAETNIFISLYIQTQTKYAQKRILLPTNYCLHNMNIQSFRDEDATYTIYLQVGVDHSIVLDVILTAY